MTSTSPFLQRPGEVVTSLALTGSSPPDHRLFGSEGRERWWPSPYSTPTPQQAPDCYGWESKCHDLWLAWLPPELASSYETRSFYVLFSFFSYGGGRGPKGHSSLHHSGMQWGLRWAEVTIWGQTITPWEWKESRNNLATSDKLLFITNFN